MADDMKARVDKVFDEFRTQLDVALGAGSVDETEKQGKGLATVTSAVERLQSVMAGLKEGKPSTDFTEEVKAIVAMLNSFVSMYPANGTKEDDEEKKDKDKEEKSDDDKKDDKSEEKKADDKASEDDEEKDDKKDAKKEETSKSDEDVWSEVDTRRNAWNRE